MEIVFENSKVKNPQVSFVLLDWSCRESFHFLHYINNQTVPRDSYEVIWIEYYSRRPSELRQELDKSLAQGKHPIMDKWIVLDKSDDIYYHKHLMYNVGIALSQGDIVTICDSDAIVQDDLVETIINEFRRNPEIALHMDEVRNNDRKFYPFNFPPLKEVVGKGAINYKDGTTTGLLDEEDPLHTRNYGACMSAKRADLIAIGGADEHIDFLGHVCGPYELTFRLRNYNRTEIWHPNHLLYHVWHPGQAGDNNYVGPHDGRHMSTTALEALDTGRVFPFQENPAIRSLRQGEGKNPEQLIPLLIDDGCDAIWSQAALTASDNFSFWRQAELMESVQEYNLVRFDNTYFGIPQRLGPVDLSQENQKNHPDIVKGKAPEEVKAAIRKLGNAQRKNRFCILDHSKLNNGVYESPELLGKFHNYNIIGYQQTLYGAPQKFVIPPQEFVSYLHHQDVVSAPDLEALKRAIEKAPAFQPAVTYPSLFKILGVDLYDRLAYFKSLIASKKETPLRHNHFVESHAEHNILENESFYYAIPQALGAIDLRNPQQRNHPDILLGPSLARLKADLDFAASIKTPPSLVEQSGTFNILKCGLKYFAIPQSLSAVDLTQPETQNHPEVLSGLSLAEVKQQLQNR